MGSTIPLLVLRICRRYVLVMAGLRAFYGYASPSTRRRALAAEVRLIRGSRS